MFLRNQKFWPLASVTVWGQKIVSFGGQNLVVIFKVGILFAPHINIWQHCVPRNYRVALTISVLYCTTRVARTPSSTCSAGTRRQLPSKQISTVYLHNSDCNSFKFIKAFAKLRKATISFVMSVRPSVRMEQLVFHCTDFCEI
jgi:hypothetical protein